MQHRGLANGVRARTRGLADRHGAELRRTLPDECSGDTHHFFAADFFAFFGAGAAAAFFAIVRWVAEGSVERKTVAVDAMGTAPCPHGGVARLRTTRKLQAVR